MRDQILITISLLFLGLTSVQAEGKDTNVSNKSLSNSCLTTIDINITKILPKKMT